MTSDSVPFHRPSGLTDSELVEWLIDNRVVKTSTGCWEMPDSAHFKTGYVAIRVGDRTITGHRLFYSVLVGQIPENLLVRHVCDNRGCVNPGHLLTGTDADNAADMVARQRQSRGSNVPHARITEADVIEIRRRRIVDGTSATTLAAEYGTSPNNIRRIVTGERWGHVLDYLDDAAKIDFRRRPHTAEHIEKIRAGATRGEDSRNAKLSEVQVREIRSLFGTGEWTKAALGRKYGVDPSLIRLIVTREIWSHIE